MPRMISTAGRALKEVEELGRETRDWDPGTWLRWRDSNQGKAGGEAAFNEKTMGCCNAAARTAWHFSETTEQKS